METGDNYEGEETGGGLDKQGNLGWLFVHINK